MSPTLTAKELVEMINAEKIIVHWAIEDIPGINMKDITKITTIDTDEHRWYVVGTVVYQVGDEFFGVQGPVRLKSESMEWCDVGFPCEAFEMECVPFEMECVPSVTYIRKQGGN